MVGIARRGKKRAQGMAARSAGAATEDIAAGPESPYTEAQEVLQRWYEERYASHVHGRLRLDSKPKYLGARNARNARRCRYCGKAWPEVKFKNVSHAFPELIGNKALRDRCECDACNKHFSQTIDDDFAKWSLPSRSMGRILGANGMPTMKASGMRVEGKPEALRVFVGRDDPRLKDDPVSKTLTLSLPRPPYFPIGVHKSLVKMAIAVMDDEEGARWPKHKRWLLEKEHTSGPAPLTKIVKQTIAGPVAPHEIHYWLFTRTAGARLCPQVVFAVQFGNVILQVHLPRREDEIAPDEQFEFGVFPSPWDTMERAKLYGPSGFRLLDMSSTSQVKGEVDNHVIRYAGVEPLTREETEALYAG